MSMNKANLQHELNQVIDAKVGKSSEAAAGIMKEFLSMKLKLSQAEQENRELKNRLLSKSRESLALLSRLSLLGELEQVARIAYCLVDDRVKPSKCPWCDFEEGENEKRTEHVTECILLHLEESLSGIEV
jgi:hypothetical protein